MLQQATFPAIPPLRASHSVGIEQRRLGIRGPDLPVRTDEHPSHEPRSQSTQEGHASAGTHWQCVEGLRPLWPNVLRRFSDSFVC